MKKRINKQQLCPNCKTGHDSLMLDSREPMCPYISLHNGKQCPQYVPMPISREEDDKTATEK